MPVSELCVRVVTVNIVGFSVKVIFIHIMVIFVIFCFVLITKLEKEQKAKKK